MDSAHKKIVIDSLEFTLKTINEELQEKISKRVYESRLKERQEVIECIKYVQQL